ENDRSRPGAHHRQVEAHVALQGADPAGTRSARAVLPQRIGRDDRGRGRLLQHALQSRIERAGKSGSDRVLACLVAIQKYRPHARRERHQMVAASRRRLDMRRRMTWFLLTAIVGAGTYANTLRATPASGFSAKTLAMATFDELDINLHTIPADVWQARLKTKGLSDMYVQSNT